MFVIYYLSILASGPLAKSIECLADFAEGDAFRCLPQRGLEALDRFAKVFGAEAESLMMDRHDEMSAGFIGHSACSGVQCE
jgi:hypothetical protein